MNNIKEADNTPMQKSPSGNGNTTIALDNNTGEARQSIINVMFNMSDSLLNWVASTWWDGKIQRDDNNKLEMVPNADYFKCPICNKSNSIAHYGYKECGGSPENKHPLCATVPQDWHPLLSRTGVSYLIGQLEAAINSNIQTGNFNKNANDIKGKSDLDQRLVNLSTQISIAVTGAVMSNKDNYNQELLVDKTYVILPQLFNIPFLESAMTILAVNILASLSKGKQMAGVEKVLGSRSHIEQEIINRSEKASIEQTNTSVSNGMFSGLFGMSKK